MKKTKLVRKQEPVQPPRQPAQEGGAEGARKEGVAPAPIEMVSRGTLAGRTDLRVRHVRSVVPGSGYLYVGRPRVYGNPNVVGPNVDRTTAVEWYRDMVTGTDPDYNRAAVRTMLTCFEQDARRAWNPKTGLVLLCWCPDDGHPCHSDVLVEHLRDLMRLKAHQAANR